MNEEKRNVAKLDQEKMEDVKGGIPYDEPALIPLDDVVVTEPGEPDPGGVIVVGTSLGCMDGQGNLSSGSSCAGGSGDKGGGCFNGYRNGTGACGAGDGVLFP